MYSSSKSVIRTAHYSLPASMFLLASVIACLNERLSTPGEPMITSPSRSLETLDWTAPVNLGPMINSSFGENSPAISKDGLSLYFTSNRPGGLGVNDIWVSHRESPDAPWGVPANVASINSSMADLAPEISRDGHHLYFVSTRPGGFGGADLWVAARENTHDDFGWETPVNLGPVINTSTDEGTPDIQGREFYFSRSRIRPGTPFDIYVSRMSDAGFEQPQLVTELNASGDQRVPRVRADGREIFFTSDRAGGVGSYDIWTSTRLGGGLEWSQPVNLGPIVNSGSFDVGLSLSDDATILLFSSDRTGGFGNFDIYYSTRPAAPNCCVLRTTSPSQPDTRRARDSEP
jgi:Tol biopolymer transport system component